MTQLYVHIGPFKTGTTAIQEYFWAHRGTYRDNGLLYPRTGIARDPWGHRHLHLAWAFRPEIWARLAAEMEQSDCDTILLSSERFSQRWAVLDAAAEIIRPYRPRMVIFIRNERELVRSMYLQVVKGSFQTGRVAPATDVSSFAAWWEANKARFVYGRMIERWARTYGSDSIEVVPYSGRGPNDSISSMCRILGVEELARPERLDGNRSIGGFAARTTVASSRFGLHAARFALRASRRIERMVPRLSSIEVRGFDPEAVTAYYREANKAAAARFPEFGRIYDQIHGEGGGSVGAPPPRIDLAT
jgi:hypothetical protein